MTRVQYVLDIISWINSLSIVWVCRDRETGTGPVFVPMFIFNLDQVHSVRFDLYCVYWEPGIHSNRFDIDLINLFTFFSISLVQKWLLKLFWQLALGIRLPGPWGCNIHGPGPLRVGWQLGSGVYSRNFKIVVTLPTTEMFVPHSCHYFGSQTVWMPAHVSTQCPNKCSALVKEPISKSVLLREIICVLWVTLKTYIFWMLSGSW